MIPELESRIAVARNAKQAAAVAKHIAINRRSWPAFRAALKAAVEQQTKVIKEREAATAEIGEHATSQIPFIGFRGMLYAEHFDIYCRELDRVMAEPAPKPQPAVPVKLVPARPARQPSQPATAAEPVAPKPRREPRRDKVAPNGRLVTLMRSGVELPDGTQGVIGDVVAMLATDAERLVMSGAGDYFTSAS
jgi:hypothetical protein